MKRRTALSSSLVVALAAFFTFAGVAAPAAADPLVLTVTPTDGTTDRTPYFEGTGTAGAALDLSLQSGDTCTTTIGLDSTWTCQFADIPMGLHYLSSVQTPLVGAPETTSNTFHWQVDGTLPQPTIVSPIEGGVWVNDPVYGSGGSVRVTWDTTEVWGLQLIVAWVTVDGVTSPYCTNSSMDYTIGEGYCWGPSVPYSDGQDVTFTAALDWYARPSSPGIVSAPVTATLWEYRWVEVLTAPTSPSSDRDLHFAGVGTRHAPLELRNDDGTVICATTVDATGAWECDIPGPLPGGDYVITAYLTTPDGWVDQSSPEVLLTVIPSPVIPSDPEPEPEPEPDPEPQEPPAAPAPAPPTVESAPAPAPPAPPVAAPIPRTVLNWSLEFGGIGQYYPGDSVTLTGTGLPEGASASAELHSTPTALGSATAGADGAFTISSSIPLDIEPGAHSFVVTVTADNADASTISVPIVVLPASVAPPQSSVAQPEDKPVRNSGTVEVEMARTGDPTTGPGSDTWREADRSDPASPSALTESLATVSYLWANPVVLGVSAIVALVLLLFVAFPAELLNSTLSEQYDRLRESRRARVPEWWKTARTALERVPVLGTLVFVLIAAVIFGFIDPRFGVDIVSLRVVLACAIGLIILALGANYLTAGIAYRAWGVRATIDLRPFGLVLAAIGVALSRLLEFLPGIMIGVFAGLVLLGTASGTSRLRVTIVRAMVLWLIAVAAWIGYSVVAEPLVGTSFGGNLVVEVLVSLTTEGLTALLVGMLPFSFLEGSVVFAASKRSWLVMYFSIVLTWVVVVLPLNFVELRGPIYQWAIVAVAFALLAVIVSAVFAWRARRKRAAEAESEPEKHLVS